MGPHSANLVAVPDGCRLISVARETEASLVFVVERNGMRAYCKRIGRRHRNDDWARRALLREGDILRALGGNQAPLLLDVVNDAWGPGLLIEPLPAASLCAIMEAGASPASLTSVAKLARRGLSSMHAHADEIGPVGVVHADLCPDNLLVDHSRSRVWFIDFFLASFREGAPPKAVGHRGTLRYAAPEVARGEAATRASDVFSLGATVLHAVSGIAPHPSVRDQAALLVAAAESPLDEWAAEASSALPESEREFFRASVRFDPRHRPDTLASMV